jgi:hypothetical protein
MSRVPYAGPNGPAEHGSKSELARKLSPPQGGPWQSFVDHSGHILVGPGKGRTLSPLMVDGGSGVPGPSLGGGEVNR